jgi:hypothetical protein
MGMTWRFGDHLDDIEVLADRLKNTEALVLIRERTKISAPLLEPKKPEGLRDGQRLPGQTRFGGCEVSKLIRSPAFTSESQNPN